MNKITILINFRENKSITIGDFVGNSIGHHTVIFSKKHTHRKKMSQGGGKPGHIPRLGQKVVSRSLVTFVKKLPVFWGCWIDGIIKL